MEQQLDNAIFYSIELCEELQKHGAELTNTYKKRLRRPALRITKPDFSKARNLGLIPSADSYKEWREAFAKPDVSPSAGAQRQPES